MSDDISSMFASMKESLQRMEEKIAGVAADVENLKKNPQKAAQPPGAGNSGSVQSTPQTQSVLPPISINDDSLSTGVSWAERMELNSDPEEEANTSNSAVEPTVYDKIRVTAVLEQTEEFLRSAFTSMENKDRRQLRHQFIVPNTPFTTPPQLDKMIAGECSKSTKANDHLFSDIQAHFLDAVGPLTGILEDINNGKLLAIDDVETAVKAALSFLGNASHRCTSIRRQGVLQDYNKDLVSYALETDDLFSSATKTLLGPAFPEKAATHLRQMKTLRESKSEVTSKQKQQNFQKAPSHYHQRGGKSYNLQRRHQPYSRGGKGQGGSQKPRK